MESFFMSWLFDKRWLFNLKNPCYEFILTVPAVLNLATIIGMAYERSHLSIEADSNSILLYTLCALEMLLCIFLLVRIHMLCKSKLKGIQENYQAIKHFIHSSQAKKVIWSWFGGCIFILSIIQTIVNSFYIKGNSAQYKCVANVIRFYVDIIAWAYLCSIIALFLIFKLAFLLFAWKNPQKYLSYKRVI